MLQTHGYWPFDDRQYAEETDREAEEIGMPDFAAIRDWMCEPFMLAKTGKTIAEHQKLTIDSYATLRELAPHLPWMPVVQGWQPDDYESHVEQYRVAGFDLATLPRVGVGSVCRRQGTLDGARIINRVADLGIKVHAFGVKVDGLALFGDRIASADSMTWSFVARRRNILMPGCVGHRNCANCFRWAHEWHRTRIMKREARPVQLELALEGAA